MAMRNSVGVKIIKISLWVSYRVIPPGAKQVYTEGGAKTFASWRTNYLVSASTNFNPS